MEQSAAILDPTLIKERSPINGQKPNSAEARKEPEILRKIQVKIKAFYKTVLAGAFSSFFYTCIGFAILFIVGEVIHLLSKGEFPSPVATLGVFWDLIKNPFYNSGPNDKGIGLQLGSSLLRVFSGFALGSLVAIPLGFLIGTNSFFRKIFYPVIQILRPVSPLAWFPLGLATTHAVESATIFVIFITSLWPTLINTSFGVSSVPEDHKNVARVFGFSGWKYFTKVLLPYSLPHIITGLRLSLGVAWLVIVASEMLSGGMGIGFFVWDSWNALSLEKVISAILIIGFIGLLFDRIFNVIEKKVSHGN